MVDITYQMVLSTLQTVALIVGIYYYIMVLRNQHRNRQAQLFMQVYNNYSTSEYINYLSDSLKMEYTDFDDFKEKYSTHPERTPYTIRCNIMDGLGVLVEENLIDINLVAKLMPGEISWHWNHFGPYILEQRKRSNHPEYMYYSEYLYNELVKAIPDHSQIKKGQPLENVRSELKT